MDDLWIQITQRRACCTLPVGLLNYNQVNTYQKDAQMTVKSDQSYGSDKKLALYQYNILTDIKQYLLANDSSWFNIFSDMALSHYMSGFYHFTRL